MIVAIGTAPPMAKVAADAAAACSGRATVRARSGYEAPVPVDRRQLVFLESAPIIVSPKRPNLSDDESHGCLADDHRVVAASEGVGPFAVLPKAEGRGRRCGQR